MVAAWRGNSDPAKLMLNGRNAEHARPARPNAATPVTAPSASAANWNAIARIMGRAT
jgi:hypothetical protein